jgi:hypothetical protein
MHYNFLGATLKSVNFLITNEQALIHPLNKRFFELMEHYIPQDHNF